MCGICGAVGHLTSRDPAAVRRMAAALAHRGPDDEGVYEDPAAVLGHRRLTIIDLTTGRQPLSNERGDIWITFNGEIYNYRDLRRRLIERGHRFRTTTDTEVIVHLYEEHGVDCVKHLRGMFAFAVWDRTRGRLFAARDRFGQKPFFYALQPDRLLFASEIKALLAHPDVGAEPEAAAVDYYLALRLIPPPLTMIRGISKLPPAHWLLWESGGMRVEPYWDYTFQPGGRRSDADWIRELEGRVREAVQSHLVSDVPVGGFLSGGIDSSIVVAMMAGGAPEQVQTFAIGSDVASFDETGFARTVADHCGTVHRQRLVGPNLLAEIPGLVRAMDEPTDPIAACMFEASRLASEFVKVVLGGDGGDEIFAGFDRYAAFRWTQWYARVPRWIREDVLRPVIQRVPESFAYKSFTQRARWLDVLGGEPDDARRYARMTSFFRFGPPERDWTYGPTLRAELNHADAEAAIARSFQTLAVGTPLQRMLYADGLLRLPEHSLMLTDRVSMAHGLETRAPLIDHELAEFCASMPDHLKIRRGVTKYAMREAAKGWLPPEIVTRAKQGFMFPVAYWLDHTTLSSIQANLISGPLVRGGWVREEAVQRLATEHRSRQTDHHVRIWMLLNLDAWHRIYLDGADVAAVAESLPVPSAAPATTG